MKVLVTGANGYIGTHVVQALSERGCEVIACDVCLDNIENRDGGIIKKEINISDLPSGNLYEALGSPDVCIHLAWRNGFVHNSPTHIEDLSSHFAFLKRLIDEGLPQLAVMGSMHEVGYWEGAIDETPPCNPTSMYGIAKNTLRMAIMSYCKEKGCVCQWIRGYYILGDDLRSNSIFGKILRAAADGKKTFPFTTGKNKYDFIEIDELAGLIASVVMQKEVSGIINCCTGRPVSLAECVEGFIKKHNLDIKLEYGVFPDRPYDSPCVYGDASKIEKIK